MKAIIIKGGTEVATVSDRPFTYTVHERDPVVRRTLESLDDATTWETSVNPDEQPTSPSENPVEADGRAKFHKAVGTLRSRGYRVSTRQATA